MESPSAALLRLMRRRVPPEKRQRTEMSCDWCKKKRCKCLRGSTADSCRACSAIGRPCTTTEPRKRRVYGSLSTPSGMGGVPVGAVASGGHQPGPAMTATPSTFPLRPPPPSTDGFEPVSLPETSLSAQQSSSTIRVAATTSQQHPPAQPPPPSQSQLDPASLDVDEDVSSPMTTDPRLLLRQPSLFQPAPPQIGLPIDVVAYRGRPGSGGGGGFVLNEKAMQQPQRRLWPPSPPPAPLLLQHQQKRPGSDEKLFEDSVGLPQYIGPVGSYTLLVKLWEVMAVWCAPIRHRNNAQTMSASQDQPGLRLKGANEGQVYEVEGEEEDADGDDDDSTVPSERHRRRRLRKGGMELPEREVADMLVALFFDKVHCDFPIFHRALFQQSYENMWSSQQHGKAEANHAEESAWVMCLSMVFVLGLEAASAQSRAIRKVVGSSARRAALQARYLSQTQAVLPEVICGSMLVHVQALMLYCRYLHMTRNRNACWNLTGAAIRVAVAIGLHRNGVHGNCSPLERELRRRIWWTLYAFERMECSSLGRTSAIDDADCNVGVPTEGLLDMGDIQPLGYVGAYAELMTLLGCICKHQYGGNGSAGAASSEQQRAAAEEDGTAAAVPREQVDFALATMEALDQWHAQLPSHLRLNSDSPTSHKRAILLLHIQYHYIVTLLCRPFLLALVAMKRPTGTRSRKGRRSETISSTMQPPSAFSPPTSEVCPLRLYARKCLDAGKAGVAVLDQLFRAGHFNSKTWWDVYFIESASMVLALGRFLKDREMRNDASNVGALKTCIHILKECKEFSPTMQRFAVVTQDFAEALVSETPGFQQPQQEQQQGAEQDGELEEVDDTEKELGPRPQQQQRQPQQSQQKKAANPQPVRQPEQRPLPKSVQPPPVQQQPPPQYYYHHAQPTPQEQYFFPNSLSQSFGMHRINEVEDLGDSGGASTGGSQSGSSPDDSYIQIMSGHDASSGIMHDPFTMAWNPADISQLWKDWPEPAEPEPWWPAQQQ